MNNKTADKYDEVNFLQQLRQSGYWQFKNSLDIQAFVVLSELVGSQKQ